MKVVTVIGALAFAAGALGVGASTSSSVAVPVEDLALVREVAPSTRAAEGPSDPTHPSNPARPARRLQPSYHADGDAPDAPLETTLPMPLVIFDKAPR